MAEKKTKTKEKREVRRRRPTQEEILNHPEWSKEHTTLRLSKECLGIIDYLLESYPGFYYNKAHLIECAVRRLSMCHKKGEIKTIIV